MTVQVLQQYGAAFVSIRSYNTTQASGGVRKLQRKLLSHAAHDPHTGRPWARSLAQAGSSGGMLQVDMMVTVPAEQQLQVLSPGTTNKTSQSVTASGILSSSSCFFLLLTLPPTDLFLNTTLGFLLFLFCCCPHELVQLLLLAACHSCLRSFCNVQEAVPAAHTAHIHRSSCTQVCLLKWVSLDVHCRG